MGRFFVSDDLLGLVLDRTADRKSFSEVCRQWLRVESLTRTKLRVLQPHRLPSLLRRFPNLTALELGRKIPNQTLTLISLSHPNLRILDLTLHKIVDSADAAGGAADDFGGDGLISVVTRCRNLTHLSLKWRRRVGDDGIISLQEHNANSLTVLDLSWCGLISDRSLEAVAEIASLSQLRLQGCKLITDRGLICLSNGSVSRSLRVLDLSDCDEITDLGVLAASRMSCLEELSLADCGEKVSDVGGVAISSISHLRKLNLSWLVGISDETLFAVADNCRDMSEIRLSGCEWVTGQGAVLLAANLPLLEMLGLDFCCNVNADDVEQIVVRCLSLRHLQLHKKLKRRLLPSTKEKIYGSCRVNWL
ncbi:F-box/LRR-repeat protein 4-like [Iris pallida]|uniref:F-box/LRR-repeat protein 4-like n=1 Tax=Iris pallida TaxID=29817 RepID=A0AAX6ELL1_IRIPA|nr:F-box/LRR-repeat protein 4-like [Iris pallida]